MQQIWIFLLLSVVVSYAWSFKMEFRQPGNHNDHNSSIIDPREIDGGKCKSRNKIYLLEGESVRLTSPPKYNQLLGINCWWKIRTKKGLGLKVHCDPVNLNKKDRISIRVGKHTTSIKGPCSTATTYEFTKHKVKVSFRAWAWHFSSFSCLVTSFASLGDGSGPCECGVTNKISRIVGGMEATENGYPWHVGITWHGGSTPFCGGSIINSKFILTAAHCTYQYTTDALTVLVAAHDVTANSNKIMTTVRKIVHPEFDSHTLENDLSLLELEDDLDFSNRKVGPVCLPLDANQTYDGVLATVTGWGTLHYGGSQTDLLQEVQVAVVTNAACTGNYGPGVITSDMICAADSGKDSCQGDSGGPMFVPIGGGAGFEIIGTVSFGYRCAEPDYPGVYSRVTANLEWIKENSINGSTCNRPSNARLLVRAEDLPSSVNSIE